MEKRHQQLAELKAYTNNIEKEVTLLLQKLQWDPKHITEKGPMVTCKYDSNHKMPLDSIATHEEKCYLTKLGYTKEDTLLPEPVDAGALTLVKFTKHETAEIINKAAFHNPLFKRGSLEHEPLTVERLQVVYTADERRAIYDAVVNTAPLCHDLTDLELPSSNDDAKKSQKKSRLEILAELRNMKRRRAKYRVAPKTRNYSDVLRDVIKTQMDSYGETTRTIIKTEYGENVYVSQQVSNFSTDNVSEAAVVKLERESPDAYTSNHRYEHREHHRARNRENKYNDDRSLYRKDKYSSKESGRSYNGRQTDISKDCRGIRHDEYERMPARDKYSSRERSENYNHKRNDASDRNQDKRHSDSRSSYYSDHSSIDRSRNYESHKTYYATQHDIKQERSSQDSDPNTQYIRDRNGDRIRSKGKRQDDSKNKYRKERSADRQKRYSPHKINEHDRSFNNGETSRKRMRSRSRSKERMHKDNKRRHDDDKYSSKRHKDYDSGNGKHYVLSEMEIKKEREF